MSKRSVLPAFVAFLVVSSSVAVAAASNPLDEFRRHLEHDIRQAMRLHAPKHRVHQPVMVKATPDEAPAEPPAPAHAAAEIPDAVLPLPEARPAETPAALRSPALPPPPTGQRRVHGQRP